MAVVHSISVYYLKITLSWYSISESLLSYNQKDLVWKSAIQLQSVIVWIHNTVNQASGNYISFSFYVKVSIKRDSESSFNK